MNNIVAEMKAAIFFNESIEDLTPMDLTGAPEEQKMEIWYLYSKYGKDKFRRNLCARKLEEARKACSREIQHIRM